MQRILCAAGVVCAALASSGTARAQQPTIQWKQTINLPKGLNLPQGAKVDILGIELGDTYDEVRAKLNALLEEVKPKESKPSAPLSPEAQRLATMSALQNSAVGAMGGANSQPLGEINMQIVLPLESGGGIPVVYGSGFKMQRDIPGASGRTYDDTVFVSFSAPSSGRQLLGIQRNIHYINQADEPRITELIARLRERLKAEPQIFNDNIQGRLYRFQFDNGRALVPPNATFQTCRPNYAVTTKQDAQNANASGQCDVVLDVDVRYGISKDHASAILFTLSDNERTKQNVVADFTFFENYVRDMRSRGGSGPKL
jgi:hypothetical protein